MRSVKLINIKVLFLLCCFLCIISPLLADNSNFVELKDWWDYTPEQRDSLRTRWNDKDIEAVLTALLQSSKLPEFINWLPPQHAECDSSADLRGIPLDNSFLDNANLSCMCLQGVLLAKSRLRHTNLAYANLQAANIGLAKLGRANLRFSDLRDTHAWKADFEEADLGGARLERAYLINANFENTDLFGTYFDYTYLCQVDLGEAKNIRYIVWGDNIKPRYIIGEEIEAESQPDSIKQESFQRAEITYRDLKTWYEKEFLYDISKKFHYRENEVITKASPWIVRLLRVLFLKWTYGYGSYPFRLLYYYLPVVIFCFCLIFALLPLFPMLKSCVYIFPSGIDDKREVLTICRPSLFLEVFYFSLLSFGNFGFGDFKPQRLLQLLRSEQPKYEPKGLARFFVVLESALGIYIFFLLGKLLLGR